MCCHECVTQKGAVGHGVLFPWSKTSNTCQDYKRLISYDRSKKSTVFRGYS